MSVFVRWYVLVVMCLVYSVSIADRYVISTVLEPIRLEFHLTDSGIAFLTGVSLALFYVSFGFPMSWLADRTSRRNVLILSLIGWSAMTACFGLARTYWQLLCTRIGVGIGEAGGTPSASSLISDFFPAARRPMALTVFSLGAPIGAWLGANVAGAIADRLGWRSVFLALGLPGVLAGVIVLVTVKEPRRGRLDAVNSAVVPPTFVQTMSFLAQQRSCVHLMIATGLTTLWGWGLMWWTPTFLMRTYSLSVGEAGAITGPVHLFGGTVATILTSWLLGQRWMSDPRRIVWFLGFVIGVSTVVSGLIYATHSLVIVKALFWIFIPSIYFYIGPTFGLFNNLAAPGMRAIYCATTLFIQNFANLVLAPQAIGLLSDSFAADRPGADALRLALLCLVPTGLWAMAHYFLSARDLVADEQRARVCVCSPGVT